MRIHLLSDVHLDHVETEHVELPLCDVRVLAGDICAYPDRRSKGLPFLKHMASGGVPVLMVLGNNDHFAGGEHGGLRGYAERVSGWREIAAEAGVRLLERESATVDEIRFLGCTWWSGVTADAGRDEDEVLMTVQNRIGDFQSIRGWSIRDHIACYAEASQWLRAELGTQDDRGSPVVITHFMPHRRSIAPAFIGSSLSPYFCNHAPAMIGMARAWLFGHTHNFVDLMIGSTRIVANPRGYPSEKSEFRTGFVIEV